MACLIAAAYLGWKGGGMISRAASRRSAPRRSHYRGGGGGGVRTHTHTETIYITEAEAKERDRKAKEEKQAEEERQARFVRIREEEEREEEKRRNNNLTRETFYGHSGTWNGDVFKDVKARAKTLVERQRANIVKYYTQARSSFSQGDFWQALKSCGKCMSAYALDNQLWPQKRNTAWDPSAWHHVRSMPDYSAGFHTTCNGVSIKEITFAAELCKVYKGSPEKASRHKAMETRIHLPRIIHHEYVRKVRAFDTKAFNECASMARKMIVDALVDLTFVSCFCNSMTNRLFLHKYDRLLGMTLIRSLVYSRGYGEIEKDVGKAQTLLDSAVCCLEPVTDLNTWLIATLNDAQNYSGASTRRIEVKTNE